MSALTPIISVPFAVLRRMLSLVGPEGALWALLMAAPAISFFWIIEGYTPLLLLAAIGGTVALGWRFRRGRLIHGVAVVGSMALLPLLPASLQGPAAALAALNLALLALLPERGVLSAGGTLRGLAVIVQAGLLVWLAAASSAGLTPAGDPLTTLTVVPVVALAHGTALVGLALLVLLSSDAIRRGLFWAAATTAIVVMEPLHTVAGPAPWPVLAGTLALLVAAVEEAHRLAYQDALTRLPSRRALDERLQRLGGSYSVAMVDVDHFKQFNDRHGHDVGDQILRMVAARLRDTPGASAYRYGGEEFTLVFRAKSLEEVADALEQARSRVGDRPFVIRGADRPAEKPKRRIFLWRERQRLSVTVSLGAAERKGWRQSPEEVLKEADAALYRAKKEGRNRIVA